MMSRTDEWWVTERVPQEVIVDDEMRLTIFTWNRKAGRREYTIEGCLPGRWVQFRNVKEIRHESVLDEWRSSLADECSINGGFPRRSIKLSDWQKLQKTVPMDFSPGECIFDLLSFYLNEDVARIIVYEFCGKTQPYILHWD
eukprot:Trichotokara_eunicae@DN11042_c0_g1_i1.p1